MTDLQKELDRAFKLISAFSVSGDAVDVIAGIKAHLRAAYKMAAPAEEEKTDG